MALNLVDCDTLAGNNKEVLVSTAQEVLGHQKKQKNKPRVMNLFLDLCDQKCKPAAASKYKVVPSGKE